MSALQAVFQPLQINTFSLAFYRAHILITSYIYLYLSDHIWSLVSMRAIGKQRVFILSICPQLVMDVEEYVPGEIEVLQDDKALTVKGRVETRQGSSTSTRTFCRNFHIPRNTREEDIDSALSKDGILTVYVPKKVGWAMAVVAGGRV